MKSPFSERSIIVENGLIEITDSEGQTQCFHVAEVVRVTALRNGETVIQLSEDVRIHCHFSLACVKAALQLAGGSRKGGAK